MGQTGSPNPMEHHPAQAEPAAMAKFLSFLSHDLRGGLNGAVLMIEVLKRQLGVDPKLASAVEDLEVVRRSILETVATMERFLNAERLRMKHFQPKHGPVNVADLVKEVERSNAHALRERAMSLEVHIDPPELVIDSDRQLLMMVLQNLVSNGIKYGRRGSVRVAVLGPGKVPGDVPCRFTVSDEGPGISPEKASQLFTPYTRGETYGQKGMGLGLYIARQAAELLGAKLWVDPTTTQGCTMHLDLKTA
jgi:signal transduction histidine kinase